MLIFGLNALLWCLVNFKIPVQIINCYSSKFITFGNNRQKLTNEVPISIFCIAKITLKRILIGIRVFCLTQMRSWIKHMGKTFKNHEKYPQNYCWVCYGYIHIDLKSQLQLVIRFFKFRR